MLLISGYELLTSSVAPGFNIGTNFTLISLVLFISVFVGLGGRLITRGEEFPVFSMPTVRWENFIPTIIKGQPNDILQISFSSLFTSHIPVAHTVDFKEAQVTAPKFRHAVAINSNFSFKTILRLLFNTTLDIGFDTRGLWVSTVFVVKVQSAGLLMSYCSKYNIFEGVVEAIPPDRLLRL